MIKRKITISALTLIAGIAGFLGIREFAETKMPMTEKTEVSAPLSAKEVAKQCDIFNQTDADILAQSPDDKDCYFSGCEGFF